MIYEPVAYILNADSELFKCIGTHSEPVVRLHYKHIKQEYISITKINNMYYA